MNPEKLLDAIGMLDDRHFESRKKSRMAPWRRRFVALIAAVLMVILSVGTAMAVSPEFRAYRYGGTNGQSNDQNRCQKANQSLAPGDHSCFFLSFKVMVIEHADGIKQLIRIHQYPSFCSAMRSLLRVLWSIDLTLLELILN